MNIETEIIKIEAELQEEAILEDKSSEYVKAFKEGYNFLAGIFQRLFKEWYKE